MAEPGADTGELARLGEDGGKLGLVALPSLDEALAWRGLKVDDSAGNQIGKVSGIHVDASSREPKWVIVRLGVFAGDAAIAFEHVAEAGGRVWAAYTRSAVRNSPKLNADQSLNAGQELQLCEHYGILVEIGRAAEVAEREPDELTAVPA